MITLIEMEGVRQKVVKKEELSVGDIVRLLSRHKYLLFMLMISSIFAATLEHVMYPSYKVSASIMVSSGENNPLSAVAARINGMGISGSGDGMMHEVPEKYFSQLRSFDFFLLAAKEIQKQKEFNKINSELIVRKSFFQKWKNIGRRLFIPKVHPDDRLELSDEKLASILTAWVGFGKAGADSINISVTTPDPDLSLLVANQVTELAAKYLGDYELKELNEAERYVKIEIESSEKDIRMIDTEMVEFKKANKLMSMDFGQGESAARAISIRKELEEANIEFEQNEKLIEALSHELKKQEDLVAESAIDRVDVDGAVGVSQPKFGLFRRVADLKKDNQYLEVRRNTLKRILNDLMSAQNPHYEQKIFDLHKKMELEYSLFQELKKQLFQIEMQRIVVKNKIRLFEKARDFEIKRSLSLKKKILLAIVIALFIGIPAAYLSELIIPTIKTRQDLDYMGLIFLGALPDLMRAPYRKRRLKISSLLPNLHEESPPLCRFDVDSPVSMSFKYIRTRILHVSELESGRDKRQIISILGSQPGEGKTFVSGNIAACIAHMGKKVLLIDCDLRKGSASEFFKLRNAQGLSEVLSSDPNDPVKFGSVVKKEMTSNLDILPAGKFNHAATEIIASNKFNELLNDLKTVYDYIILDTPPLVVVPDAALAAKQSDLMIMVASANLSREENVRKAIETLQQFGHRKIYAVLNRAEVTNDYLYVVPNKRLNKTSWNDDAVNSSEGSLQ